MQKVKISSKYQIVIPKEIREALKLKPGQEVKLLNINGSITLIPVRPIESYRGMLKGSKIDFSEIREKRDREI
jgi:AbrB family looped-hinge helix DNA binding protein